MQLHENLEYMKLTICALCKNPHNHKLIESMRTIVETTREEGIIDKEALLFFKIIKRVLVSISVGVEDSDIIMQQSLDEPDNQHVQDLVNRLKKDMKPEMLEILMDYYTIIINYKPLLDVAGELEDDIRELKISTGIIKTMDNIKKLKTRVEGLSSKMEQMANNQVAEELLISSDGPSIGLSKLKKDRRLENSFTLSINPLFDRLFGGGLKLRKTYLFMSRSQGYKSGTMTNIVGYVAKNPNNIIPEEFLDGLKPLILYVTHENTVLQTVKRHLKFEGYSDEEQSCWSEDKFDEKVREIFMPKGNGIHTAILALPSKAIFIKDLERKVEEYARAGFKVILLVEDYLKHVATKIGPDESNMQPGDKLAIELNDLTKKIYCPIITASQINREGLKEMELRKRSTDDYIKYIHEGYMADSYNAFQSYENVVALDRGVMEGTNVEYVVYHSKKDRDNEKRKNGKDNGYIVAKFDDDIGFRIEADNNYTSLSELRPASSRGVADAFNIAQIQLEERMKMENMINDAKKVLIDNGDNPDMYTDIDILERARHIVELSASPYANAA